MKFRFSDYGKKHFYMKIATATFPTRHIKQNYKGILKKQQILRRASNAKLENKATRNLIFRTFLINIKTLTNQSPILKLSIPKTSFKPKVIKNNNNNLKKFEPNANVLANSDSFARFTEGKPRPNAPSASDILVTLPFDDSRRATFGSAARFRAFSSTDLPPALSSAASRDKAPPPTVLPPTSASTPRNQKSRSFGCRCS